MNIKKISVWKKIRITAKIAKFLSSFKHIRAKYVEKDEMEIEDL